MLNLDRILPVVAPALRRVLQPTKGRRRAQFDAFPPGPGRVVFLGDSITEGGMWEGWFPDLPTSNRGISGETIGEVLGRLDSATDSPLAISLMIGTNDLHGLGKSSDPKSIAAQMRELVARIQELAPTTPLIINSVLPRSAHFAERVKALNADYRRIAEDAGARYVDLWPAMADADGALRSEFTIDGIHLTADGYRAWVDVLRPVLDDALTRDEAEDR